MSAAVLQSGLIFLKARMLFTMDRLGVVAAALTSTGKNLF